MIVSTKVLYVFIQRKEDNNVPTRELLAWNVFPAWCSSEQAARECPLVLAAAVGTTTGNHTCERRELRNLQVGYSNSCCVLQWDTLMLWAANRSFPLLCIYFYVNIYLFWKLRQNVREITANSCIGDICVWRMNHFRKKRSHVIAYVKIVSYTE